jgi:hypothetical protein
MRLLQMLAQRVRRRGAVEREFLKIVVEGLLREITLGETEPLSPLPVREAGALRFAKRGNRQDRK